MNLDDAPVPQCTVCHCGLYDTELGHQACRLCTRRVDDNLTALAGPVTFTGHGRERKLVSGLYAALSLSLTPGASGGGPAVSGSRTAPLPLRLEVLNLMTAGGPILGPLETWVRDWETQGRAELCEAGTLQERVDHAVGTLRFNLEWAAASHLAFDEFAREVRLARRQCEVQVSGEKPPVRFHVICPCGQPLGATLNSPGERCTGCGTQYSHRELMDLPLAERRAAA